MENKCLITTLKGNITGNDFPMYGAIELFFDLTNVVSFTAALVRTGTAHVAEVVNYDTDEIIYSKSSVWNIIPVETWNTFAGKRIIYRLYNRYTDLNVLNVEFQGTGDYTGSVNIDDFRFISDIDKLILQDIKVTKSGNINNLVNAPFANSITRLGIGASGAGSTATGRFDAFITNLEAATPTLLLPNLTNLYLTGWFDLPEGYTIDSLKAKYQAAGVTTITLYRPPVPQY